MIPISKGRKDLLLPKEHGSWSLAFEPVVLGLLVAPSAAGAALTLAAAAGFFARRPLKLAATLPDHDPRRGPARGWSVVFALLSLVALAGAGGLGSIHALWPLLLAVPFGGLFLWFDLRHAMRAAEAELAGSIAFALLPATYAKLAGWPTPAALALAVLSLARNVPTVLTVRAFLRSGKGQAAGAVLPLAASGAAFAVVSLLAGRGLVPAAAVAVSALFLGRTVWLVTTARPAWPARRVGMLEAALGLLHLGVLTAAFHLR